MGHGINEELNSDNPKWTHKDGTASSVTDMSTSQLRKAIKVCTTAHIDAMFSCNEDKWCDWITLLEKEIASRPLIQTTKQRKGVFVKNPATKTQRMKCFCGAIYSARVVDLTKGRDETCSKRCAGVRRLYGKAKATKVTTNEH